MPKSTRKQGAYYLKRSVDHFKKEGWKVEKLEVAIPFFINGRAIFSRKDLLGADLFCWNDTECFIVQVKSTDGIRSGAVSDVRLKAKKQFAEWNVPLKKVIMIWVPRQKPLVELLI